VDLARELQRQQRFTDADGVNPGPLAPGEAGTFSGCEETQALTEFLLVVAAPQHPQGVAGEQSEEDQREKKIVDEERAARGERKRLPGGRGQIVKIGGFSLVVIAYAPSPSLPTTTNMITSAGQEDDEYDDDKV